MTASTTAKGNACNVVSVRNGEWSYCRVCRGVITGRCDCVMYQDCLNCGGCEAHRAGGHVASCRCPQPEPPSALQILERVVTGGLPSGRMVHAIGRLAELLPNGHHLAATDAAQMLNDAADIIQSLRAQLRSLRSGAATPTDVVWIDGVALVEGVLLRAFRPTLDHRDAWTFDIQIGSGISREFIADEHDDEETAKRLAVSVALVMVRS